MQILRRLALPVDVAEDAVHLLGSQTRGIGDILDRHAIVLSEQAQVHVSVRQREVELLLRLREGVRVRRRGT